MGRKGFWIASIGIIFGFVAGFFFANMLNRQEMESLKAKAAQAQNARNGQTPDGDKMVLGEAEPGGQNLSSDEIKQKIRQADANPNDFQFQKDLGLSLYLYEGMKKDTDLLPDAKRLMLRAIEKFPKDFDLLVALGNVNFDLGQSKQDNNSLDEARQYYTQALQVKPGQVDLQTDLGSTYFLANPPQYDKALAEYRKSLQMDPEHVRTLDNISRTLLMMGQTKEAETDIAKIKSIDDSYPGLSDLDSLLAQKKDGK
jgi:tetratricopeptide (TPR) repeat protein